MKILGIILLAVGVIVWAKLMYTAVRGWTVVSDQHPEGIRYVDIGQVIRAATIGVLLIVTAGRLLFA